MPAPTFQGLFTTPLEPLIASSVWGILESENLEILQSQNLGILKFTWSSEHYSEKQIYDELSKNNFEIIDSKNIGENVYPPLADYYLNNRNELRKKILTRYSKYVEKILFESMKKMKISFEKGLIDYKLLKCKKLALDSR